MNIIALDTCTEYCCAALLYQGQVWERVKITRRGHSDLILGMMDELFKQAGVSISAIDAVGFGRGPGSFTGVRVGVAVAQGIAFARDIPVIPISTLAAIAQDAADTLGAEYLAVAMDARMGEIYCASYVVKNGQVVLLDEERVCPPAQFTPLQKQQWSGVGAGWGEYGAILQNCFADNLAQVSIKHYPKASTILKLALVAAEAGTMLPADQALPVYLRNNVAHKQGQQ